MDRQDRIRILAIAGALVIFGAGVLKLAWVCHDAFITFRTIDNFVGGYGLRWNIAERVQTFTHPLWLMVLTPVYTLFGHLFYVVIGVSVGLGLATVWLVATRLTDHWLKVIWIGIAIAVSKAFAEYSTSGLENPYASSACCFSLRLLPDASIFSTSVLPLFACRFALSESPRLPDDDRPRTCVRGMAWGTAVIVAPSGVWPGSARGLESLLNVLLWDTTTQYCVCKRSRPILS